jgi:hypothetical protein
MSSIEGHSPGCSPLDYDGYPIGRGPEVAVPEDDLGEREVTGKVSGLTATRAGRRHIHMAKKSKKSKKDKKGKKK